MNVRNIILLVLVVIGVIFLRVYLHKETLVKGFLGGGNTNDPTKSFLTYENPAYSIKYPANWTLSEEDGKVIFESPEEGTSDYFQEKLSIEVFVDDTANSINLDEFTNLEISKKKKVTILLSNETMLDGNPAYELIYTKDIEGVMNFEWMQIWTLKDKKFYMFTYSADAESYSDYLGTIRAMINSFKIN